MVASKELTLKDLYSIELLSHEVHIWQADLDVDSHQETDFLKILAQEERNRASRYLFAKDRRNFVVARGILRCLLAHYLKTTPDEIIFSYGLAGKPEIDKPTTQLTFNLSHSHSAALYAISWKRALGIDVEALGIDFSSNAIADFIFSDHERTILSAYPKNDWKTAFLRGWTRKEAYVKARGVGLSFPLKQIEVPFEENITDIQLHLGCEKHSQRSQDWHWLYSLDSIPEYVSALVVDDGPVSLSLRKWPIQTDAMLKITANSLGDR